ncbi:hypothetical protein JTE90_007683 [Oedothorax gibbosus]|uniref:Nose resistant-to-fluoxetine protein N-terminal domain-containing protein n=1 Tax=Oedothorax gibbosus TaxID=931172 RepID=A0AAV6UJI4_9ARAC|nr:hypothetical protein JTE90_007683 [Oedothorax gibbosus]
MKLTNSALFIFCISLTSLSLMECNSITETSLDNDNSTMEAEDLQKAIERMQKNMQEVIDSFMKQISPFAAKIGLYSSASFRCLVDTANSIRGIKRLESWAFKMLDASGKLSPGLLEGTSSALGDYDECLDVVSPHKGKRHFTGKYCLLEVKPPGVVVDALKEYQVTKDKANHTLANTKSFIGFLRKVRTNPDHVIFRMGMCVPSSCDAEGIQSIMSIATDNMDMPVEVVRCESKKDFELQTHQIVIISIILVFVVVVLLATVIPIFFTKDNEPPSSASSKEASSKDASKCSKLLEICSKFSISHNTKRLLDCTNEDDASDTARGLKVLTILFAIFTHTYALPHRLHLYRFRNTLNFTKFIDEILFGAVANSSVGVDTFFFLAGFHFVYNRWRLINRPNVLSYIFKFIILTCIRMMAIQVLVALLFFLFPLFGSGPLWHEFVENPLDNCRNTWWMNLLFIQNFLGPYDICLYQTWMLATIMQIFVITSVIVYALHKWPMYGIFSIFLTTISAMMAIAAVTALADFPASFTIYFYDYRTSIKLWKYVYTQFYTHIGPQCIGMLTAYIISECSKKIHKRLALPLWIACFLCLSSIVFGLHDHRHGEPMVRGLSVLYAALHRPAWAVALGWIVYACATGHGGVVNSVLSWKALVPLERLCYLAYLLHVPLMYYQGGTQRERMFMGHYNQIMCFLSYAVVSFLLAFACYLLFQAPYEVIERFLLRKPEGDIWESNPVSSSQVSIQSDKEPEEKEEDTSKVLYNRYQQSERF